MMCSPFLRGFLPGVLVGLSTSLLFLSLWRHTPDISSQHTAITETHPTTTGANAEVFLTNQENPELRRGDSEVVSMSELVETTNSAVSGSFKFLILVHSSPDQRPLRDAVRATWLRERRRSGEYVARFVVGVGSLNGEGVTSLAAEQEVHRDLLLLPEVEEEENTVWPSSRKLLESFSWAVSNVNFTAIFKCNSATFADMERLLERVQVQGSHVWGYFAGGVKAVRHSESSVVVEEDWVLCSHYLPYPQGGGYLISRDIVELLVEMGPHLEHYHHDDIALGVWLSPLKGIVKQHSLWFNSGYYSRGCLNSFLVSHRESVESMAAKAASLEGRGVFCEREYQSRLAYHFNWTAPASRCCVRKVRLN